MGLTVTGVDPGEMDPVILQHPRFQHWRSKAAAVKRRNYSPFRWLAADANVAPNYTLDVVQDIVTYPTSRIQGLLLTLKLPNYELLDQLDSYLDRIRSWKYQRVEARQLAHNRREVTVVAHRT
jgi:23S rRNA (cytidine2498-2'-O)-methyltransferase